MNKGVYFCGTLVWFITVIHPLADVSFNLSALLVINTMWEIMLALAGMQPQVHHHLILPVYVVFQSLPVLWRKQVGKGFWGNFPYSSLTHNCLALFQVHSQKHVSLTPFSSPSEGPDIQQNIPAKLEDDFQYSAELGLSQIWTWTSDVQNTSWRMSGWEALPWLHHLHHWRDTPPKPLHPYPFRYAQLDRHRNPAQERWLRRDSNKCTSGYSLLAVWLT